MKELEESQIGMSSANSIHNYLQSELDFAIKNIFKNSSELKKIT